MNAKDLDPRTPHDTTVNYGDPSEALQNDHTDPHTVVLAFDMDGTLTTGDIGHAFLKWAGVNLDAMRAEAKNMQEGNATIIGGEENVGIRWEQDRVFPHIFKHLSEYPEFWADANKPPRIHKEDMEQFARGYKDFQPGALQFVDNIRGYVAEMYGNKINLECAVISGGMEPIIKNLAITQGGKFDSISCIKPIFKRNGEFDDIAIGMTPWSKVMYVKAIESGHLEKGVPTDRNKIMTSTERPRVPGMNVVLFADGENDLMALKHVQRNGGVVIGVESAYAAKMAEAIGQENIVKGDYTKGGPIWNKVVERIDAVAVALEERQKARIPEHVPVHSLSIPVHAVDKSKLNGHRYVPSCSPERNGHDRHESLADQALALLRFGRLA